jgi:hypothetical protein
VRERRRSISCSPSSGGMAWQKRKKARQQRIGRGEREERESEGEDGAHQVCIEAIECNEFIVCAELLYLAFAHHCYPVSVADGAEAMRNDDGRLCLRLCTG